MSNFGNGRRGAAENLPSSERRSRILAIAREEGRLDVAAASGLLRVSPETVRRDLKVLEGHGLVRRAYGCAYPVDSVAFESDLQRRETELVPEKRRIAVEASRHLGTAETVFIDEGYLPQLVANELPATHKLTVVTASLPVAAALVSRTSYTVVVLGGRLRASTVATVDKWAVHMLADLVIDLAFLGANGISRDHGLTTPDPAVAEVKTAAARASRRRVFIGAHNKFGAAMFCRFASIGDLDEIITDTGVPLSEARRYELLGPKVLRV